MRWLLIFFASAIILIFCFYGLFCCYYYFPIAISFLPVPFTLELLCIIKLWNECNNAQASHNQHNNAEDNSRPNALHEQRAIQSTNEKITRWTIIRSLPPVKSFLTVNHIEIKFLILFFYSFIHIISKTIVCMYIFYLLDY
jgi:hypothetical protein